MKRSMYVTAMAVMGLWGSQCFGAKSTYQADIGHWTLDNGWITAEFTLTTEGIFQTDQLKDKKTGDTWTPARGRATSIIRFQADDTNYDVGTGFSLWEQYTEPVTPAGIRQVIVLRDFQRLGEVRLNLEVYDNQPALRYSLQYKNLTGMPVHVKFGNMLSWTLADGGKKYTSMRVNQWSVLAKPENFQPLSASLDPTGRALEVYSGAHGDQCAWLAIRDTDNRGLFAGWEFDGRAKATIKQSAVDGYVALTANIDNLYHPVGPNGIFQMPAAFLGLFHGDFDEAGYRTQRFAESVIAKPAPDATSFPYVGWDSWAYQTDINEQTLRHEAEIAASLGVELFTVDLGWARMIGDWHSDRDKFPNGLGAISDYVHSLGMKFGLHFALTEADPNSPVLAQHPDWRASEDGNYQGADSLCLSNQPTRDWVIEEALRIIDTYKPDWILQDGENMVKTCTRTDHTHDPLDSNYSNAVDGLNYVVTAIQQARPNVYWENCENGGNMMTFNMVRNYVTSITNDASGAQSARQAVFGATYPFPPRYTDRYMPDEGLSSYVTNSYYFGGPWVMMIQLAKLPADKLQTLSAQIAAYKAQRGKISAGKVFHISAAPAPNSVDVLQSYNSTQDNAVAVVTRPQTSSNSYLLKPKGLNGNTRYQVWFDNDSRRYSQTGTQLMQNGVTVSLPNPFSSAVVHFDKQ